MQMLLQKGAQVSCEWGMTWGFRHALYGKGEMQSHDLPGGSGQGVSPGCDHSVFVLGFEKMCWTSQLGSGKGRDAWSKEPAGTWVGERQMLNRSQAWGISTGVTSL